jgi:RNase H-fold protein (predicted Holliday junction resolvase)
MTPQSTILLGFDPGRDKCGIAVMGSDSQLYYHQVVAAAEALATLESLSQKFPIERIVMGDRTTAQSWKAQMEEKLALPIVLVDEHNSTVEARDRYWQMYPPKGLARLIPQGMRLPPRPVDDLVAILLIERYWGIGNRE